MLLPIYIPNEQFSAQKDDLPLLVMLAGYPDNQYSAWSVEVINTLKERYRVIMLCIPGYQSQSILVEDAKIKALLSKREVARKRAWGYDFEAIVDMLHETIDTFRNESDVYMLSHDWGAFIAQVYLMKYSTSIKKLILCDIGYVNEINYIRDYKNLIQIGIYSIWFATSYFISQAISYYLGSILYGLYFVLIQYYKIYPLDERRDKEDEAKEIVDKCYPYYYLWRGRWLNKYMKFHAPPCPTLFMVSRLLITL